VSSEGYDPLQERIAENPALEAVEMVEIATDDGLDPTTPTSSSRTLC